MKTTQAYHFIGLDIHKRTIAFCEKDPLGNVADRGTLLARKEELVAFATSRTCPFVAGIEATLFSGWVYDALLPYAAELHVGHPRRLKALSKNKNDRIDAEMLANLLRADLFPACYMASPEVRELRRVLRYRNFLVRHATRMKNKASGILMETGVEYAKSKLHGKKYFSELLDSLEDVPPSVVNLLRMTRTNLEVFTAAQRQLLQALTQHTALRDRVELLKTVGGVGDVTALTWALEIGDPHRFSNIRRAQSYCGLCSAQHESGDKQWRLPLSKERNPYLQCILIEAAKLAPSKHDYLAHVRDCAVARGYNKNRATLAVARKLVAYLMAVDKSGQPFVAPEVLGGFHIRFSCRRIPPNRDWVRDIVPDTLGYCFGRGGSPKRKHRTHAVNVVSANGCLVARTYLVSKTENRKRSDGAVRETNSRTAKGGHCPNDGGPVALRCLRRVIRKLPILGTAPRPGRLSLRPTISYLIAPRMCN